MSRLQNHLLPGIFVVLLLCLSGACQSGDAKTGGTQDALQVSGRLIPDMKTRQLVGKIPQDKVTFISLSGTNILQQARRFEIEIRQPSTVSRLCHDLSLAERRERPKADEVDMLRIHYRTSHESDQTLDLRCSVKSASTCFGVQFFQDLMRALSDIGIHEPVRPPR